MSEVRVQILSNGMDAGTARAVRAACKLQGLPCDDAPGASDATVIVASLPAGERRIPIEAAEATASANAAVPLVLLGNEPLTRGHVVLVGGRIHLFAPPHDPARLGERLAHVVAGRGPDHRDRAPFVDGPSRSIQRWSNDYWACLLHRAAADGTDTISRLLSIEKRPDGCFGIFPTPTRLRSPEPLIDVLERLLLGDDRSLWQWLGDLNGHGAVVAYDSEEHELILDLPAGTACSGFLLSPHRIPRVSCLPTGTQNCIAAAPGDVLLAAMGEGAVGLLDAETLRAIVGAGAVAGAAELRQRLDALPRTDALLFLEAR